MSATPAPTAGDQGARSNLREFLDELPRSPCAVRPSFGLCTVCFRINEPVALHCPVYQEHRKGLTAEGTDREPVAAAAGVPLPSHLDSIEQLRAELEEVPEFEFSPPPPEADDEEVFDAEVIEAEVIKKETPPAPPQRPPGPRPKLRAPSPPLPTHAPPAAAPAPVPAASKPSLPPAVERKAKKVKRPKLKVTTRRKPEEGTRPLAPPLAGTPGIVVPAPTPQEIAGEVPLPGETPPPASGSDEAPKKGFEVVEDEPPKPGANDDDVGIWDELLKNRPRTKG